MGNVIFLSFNVKSLKQNILLQAWWIVGKIELQNNLCDVLT